MSTNIAAWRRLIAKEILEARALGPEVIPGVSAVHFTHLARRVLESNSHWEIWRILRREARSSHGPMYAVLMGSVYLKCATRMFGVTRATRDYLRLLYRHWRARSFSSLTFADQVLCLVGVVTAMGAAFLGRWRLMARSLWARMKRAWSPSQTTSA